MKPHTGLVNIVFLVVLVQSGINKIQNVFDVVRVHLITLSPKSVNLMFHLHSLFHQFQCAIMERFIIKIPKNVSALNTILIGQDLIVKYVGQEVSGELPLNHVLNVLKNIIIIQSLINVLPALLDIFLIPILNANHPKLLTINVLKELYLIIL